MESIINRNKYNEKFDESSVLNVLYNRYGTEYDLTEAKYTSANDTILIKCIKHNKEIKKHFYTLNVDDYIPCKDCRRIKVNNFEMTKMLNELYPTYELIDDILVRSKSIEVKCNKHNSIFKMNFENLNRLYKSKDFSNLPIPCKECKAKAKAKGKPITEVKENKVIKNVDKYSQAVSNLNCTILKSSNGDADIQCNQCNKTHSVRIESYALNGYGCPYCNINKILQESNSNKMRNYRDKASAKFVFSENFKFKVRNKYNNDDSFIIGEYQGMSEKIKCNCNLHGEYEAAPQDIINSEVKSKMCPSCKEIPVILSHEEVIARIENKHPDKFTYDKLNYTGYLGNSLIINCKVHGEFSTNMIALMQYNEPCPDCISQTSKAEKEIISFIKDIDESVGEKARIENVEFDITLNKYNLLIEYNGIMFHSFGKGITKLDGTESSMFNNIKSFNINNHLNKTILANKYNSILFHIFENEWENHVKRKIWQSMISIKMNNGLKIYARKCNIVELDFNTTNEFLERCHIQGKNIGFKYSYGLTYNDKLVSIMTFGKPRGFNQNKYEWEIHRFCSELNTTVIGGASKLLKHFERLHNPKSIMSYANRRWSVGNMYEKLGFTFSHNSQPNALIFNVKNPSVFKSRNFVQKTGDLFNPKHEAYSGIDINEIKVVDDLFSNIIKPDEYLKINDKSDTLIDYDSDNFFDTLNENKSDEYSKTQYVTRYVKNILWDLNYRIIYDSGNIVYYKLYDNSIQKELNYNTVLTKSDLSLNDVINPFVRKAQPKIDRGSVTDRFVRDRIKHYDAMIELGKTKYGNTIQYLPLEESGFQNNRSKVKFICNKHGEFETVAENFKLKSNKFGCIKCNSEYNAEIKKSSGMNSKESSNSSTNTRRINSYNKTVELLTQKFKDSNYTFLDFESANYTNETTAFKMICNGIVNNNKVHESKEIYIRAANAKITTSLHLCEECRKFKL